MRKHIKNLLISIGILAASFGISMVLHNVLTVDEHITTVFVFAVFLISLTTEGYIWGVSSAVLSMIIVNIAFTAPFFAISIGLPENILSALVMITISVLTSTITTRQKKWHEIKNEGEREKMRANLLRAVSHDLRTPLTTIYGSSSAILENFDSLSDEQKQRMVSGIKSDADWLIRMVENLLSITRIDGGNVSILKSPTVLEELIDSVILKFKKRYPYQNVNITLPEELVIIPMDPLLIEQVIINILENAVEHAHGMTKLDLTVKALFGNAVFVISDDGCGIPEERLEKIFTEFFDTDDHGGNSGKRNAGIGLSVCATIIKAHGGEISAQNLKAGGAAFKFTLATEEIEYDK